MVEVMVKRAGRVEMRWKKEQMYVSMYSYYYYCCCYCEGGIEQIQKYRHEAVRSHYARHGWLHVCCGWCRMIVVHESTHFQI